MSRSFTYLTLLLILHLDFQLGSTRPHESIFAPEYSDRILQILRPARLHSQSNRNLSTTTPEPTPAPTTEIPIPPIIFDYPPIYEYYPIYYSDYPVINVELLPYISSPFQFPLSEQDIIDENKQFIATEGPKIISNMEGEDLGQNLTNEERTELSQLVFDTILKYLNYPNNKKPNSKILDDSDKVAENTKINKLPETVFPNSSKLPEVKKLNNTNEISDTEKNDGRQYINENGYLCTEQVTDKKIKANRLITCNTEKSDDSVEKTTFKPQVILEKLTTQIPVTIPDVTAKMTAETVQ